MFNPRQRHACAALLLLVCSLLLVVGPAASAAHLRSHHAYTRAVAVHGHGLLAAGRSRARDDRMLVAEATGLTRCLSAHRARPARCNASRRALQQGGAALARAERRLARLASASGQATTSRSTTRSAASIAAPQLGVSGESLAWSAPAGAGAYVLRRRIPGQADFFVLVHGTSAIPPAIPGTTVFYSVRSATPRSLWSAEQQIAYAPSVAGVSLRAAPVLTLSGQTLSWGATRGVKSYILVRRLAGHAPQYTALAATSLTLTAAADARAHFSVRTAVAGSVWSEPSVAPLAAAAPATRAAALRAAAMRAAAAHTAEVTPVSPPPVASALPGALIVGVDTGNWRGNLFNELAAGGIKNLRVSDLSNAAVAEAEAAGCSIAVLTFQAGGTIAGRNPAAYAAEVLAYAKQHPEVQRIEVLNEPELLPDSHNYGAYVALLKATHEALASLPAAGRPKLLASWAPTYGFGKGWAAAGGLAYVDEVVVHAYGGGTGQHKGLEGARELITQARAESGKPVAVTEIGWPTAVGQPATGDSQQWSEAQQAAAITGFAAWAHTQPYISVVIFFNAVDYGTNMWYGIERTDRSHKPSFSALALAAR
jgi:hypothetical protein